MPTERAVAGPAARVAGLMYRRLARHAAHDGVDHIKVLLCFYRRVPR